MNILYLLKSHCLILKDEIKSPLRNMPIICISNNNSAIILLFVKTQEANLKILASILEK